MQRCRRRLAIALTPATGASPNLQLHPTVIASTAKLAAGSYAVIATADIEQALCWIGTKANASAPQQHGLTLSTSDVPISVSETSTIKVTKGQRVREYCAGDSSPSGDNVLAAGITAISLGSSAPGEVTAPDASDDTRK